MSCVKISNKGRVKKWGNSTKIWGKFSFVYLCYPENYEAASRNMLLDVIECK